jgi:hypothetical protein
MKIKPSFLAASILAASSLSHAGLAPIGDTQLGDVTGQAGVTIEPTIRAEIGSIVYTDEGSIGINNIVFGGANKSSYFGINSGDIGFGVVSGDALDGAKIKIDVAENGDVGIDGRPSGVPFGGLIDFRLATGNINLMSRDGLQTATFVDSINMTGLLTGFLATIKADSLVTEISVSVGIDDLDIDLSSLLGVKVENAFIVSSTYFEELDGRANGDPSRVRLLHLTADFDIDLYADDDGLHIDPVSIEFDMGIGAIMIADASIGSFRMNNINLNDLSVVISGHQ